MPTTDCNLPAPTSASGTHNGTSLSLSWNAVSGAASYRMRVIDMETSQVIYSEIEAGTSTTIPNTNANHDYRAQISATCNSGGGESTNIIIVDMNGV